MRTEETSFFVSLAYFVEKNCRTPAFYESVFTHCFFAVRSVASLRIKRLHFLRKCSNPQNPRISTRRSEAVGNPVKNEVTNRNSPRNDIFVGFTNISKKSRNELDPVTRLIINFPAITACNRSRFREEVNEEESTLCIVRYCQSVPAVFRRVS